ncbi:MAG: hypothetical protein ABIQ15_14145 [Nocardioides sp.]
MTGLPREEAFTSRLRSPAVAARVGVVLAGLVAAAVVTATVARSRRTAPTEGGPGGASPGR